MADEGHIETDRILADLEKKLKKVYQQASRNAEGKFRRYMRDFVRKDEEHQKDVKAGLWTEEEYKDWRKNQLLYAGTLNEIRDVIAKDLQHTDKMAIQMVRDTQPDIYATNYNYATYSIEQGAQVDTSFTLYDRDTVERLMKDDPKLLPKPSKRRQREIDASDRRWNRQKLQSAFTASIISGDSIPTMAKRISSVAVMDWHSAVRNARTMTTGAENGGRSDSYKRAKSLGIDVEQEWVATLDGRTRDSHRAIDGEKIKVGEKFSNGLRFPGDPEGRAGEVYNCRCTTVAVIDGIDPMAFDKSDVLQRKLDNADITYEEWKNQHRHMDYRKVVLDDEPIENSEKEGKVIFHKIVSVKGNFYLSENATIKPRKLHTIIKYVNEAQKAVNIDGEKPKVVIIGDQDLGRDTVGRFTGETNTLYIKPTKDNALQKHSIFHENFHWADWQSNNPKTLESDAAFIDFMCKKCKKKLDKLGITTQNVSEISRYAKAQYALGRYDEVYVEYETKEALKE